VYMKPSEAAPTGAVLCYASAKSEETRNLLTASLGFLCIHSEAFLLCCALRVLNIRSKISNK
jgi:hypothetical protein